MSKVQKPCRVCGKMYTPCPDCENDKSAFHWRSVACSRECAMEYFRRIEESRNSETITKVKPQTVKENILPKTKSKK